MSRLAFRPLISAALLLAASTVAAEAQSPSSQPPPGPRAAPAESARDTESSAKRPRAISSGVAAQLAAAMPKYTPPPPQPEAKPQEEDLRETDKPRNGIIRLPQYIVVGKRNPVLSERAVHTREGLAALAIRRYFTDVDRALNAYSLPLFGTSGEARALAMYEEDERLANMRDLAEDARAATLSDAAAGTYIKRETDRTFLRTGDFGWQGGSIK